MKIGFNAFKPSFHSVIHLHVLSNILLSISIDPQPHLYTRVTSSSQASAVLFSCFEFCCHKVWRHSSTDQWTQECQQQTLTCSTETAVTARPLLIIVVLTADATCLTTARLMLSIQSLFSQTRLLCFCLKLIHSEWAAMFCRDVIKLRMPGRFCPSSFDDAAIDVCSYLPFWSSLYCN